MKLLKIIALALTTAGLSACGGFMNSSYSTADNTTYSAPRASLAPATAEAGGGASGGGGGGAGIRR
jgi:uncharacterized membrane protein